MILINTRTEDSRKCWNVCILFLIAFLEREEGKLLSEGKTVRSFLSENLESFMQLQTRSKSESNFVLTKLLKQTYFTV